MALSQFSVRSVARRATALLVGILVVTGCSLFEPSPTDVYSLASLDGDTLPATLRSATAVDGTVYEFQRISTTLILFSNGEFRFDGQTRNVWNGVPRDSAWARTSGKYLRTDASVVLDFTDNEGIHLVFTYETVDGNRRLRGSQWGRWAEYVRR